MSHANAGLTPRARLRLARLVLDVVAPGDAEAQFKAGKRSVIEVVVNTVDPLRADYASYLAANVSNAVNQTIIRRAVEESEGYATAASGGSAAVIPPEVVAAPTEAQVTNIAPSEPRVLSYFGPAVLALLPGARARPRARRVSSGVTGRRIVVPGGQPQLVRSTSSVGRISAFGRRPGLAIRSSSRAQARCPSRPMDWCTVVSGGW